MATKLNLMEQGTIALAEKVKKGKTVPFLEVPYPSMAPSIPGLRAGEITILAGETWAGKTTFGLDLLCSVTPQLDDDEFVAFVALEDDTETFLTRLLGKVSGINPRHLMFRRPEEWTEEELLEIDSAARDWESREGSKLLYYCSEHFASDGKALKKIREWLEVQRQQPRTLRLLVIDYLQLLTGQGRGSLHERERQSFRSLERIAQQFGTHIIVISALRKPLPGVNRNKVQIADISGSGLQGYGAQVILGITRCLQLDGTPWARIDVLKSRWASASFPVIGLTFDPQRLTFVDNGGRLPQDAKPRMEKPSLGVLEKQLIRALAEWASDKDDETLRFCAADLIPHVEAEGTPKAQEIAIGRALHNLGWKSSRVYRERQQRREYAVPVARLQAIADESIS